MEMLIKYERCACPGETGGRGRLGGVGDEGGEELGRFVLERSE